MAPVRICSEDGAGAEGSEEEAQPYRVSAYNLKICKCCPLFCRMQGAAVSMSVLHHKQRACQHGQCNRGVGQNGGG